MSNILLTLSNTFTSVGWWISDVFTKVVTVNYYVGGSTFSALQSIYLFLYSLAFTVLSAIGLALEDLVVFLIECSEYLYILVNIFIQIIDSISLGISNAIHLVVNTVLFIVNSIGDGALLLKTLGVLGIQKVLMLLSLIGRSVVMLVTLFTSTCYITAFFIKSSFISLITNSRNFSEQVFEKICTAPYEVYLGIIVAILSSVFISKVIIRKIQESNISLEYVGSILLYVLSTSYVMLLRTFARLIGLLFKVVELTVNNIRLPMFSQPGESDEDSDDEDQESLDGDDRRLKRFNILANNGSDEDDSMEAELYRQVQREREDKLCVVCVDKIKCIMMLPCRHLCVCERCWRQLEATNEHNSTCPLCRNPVQQIIKAYL